MNDVLAAIAVAAFAGWSVTLVALMRSLLPMANALNVQGKLNAHIDTQIRSVVERVLARQGRLAEPGIIARKEPPAPQSALDAIRDAFGGDVMHPLDEQPDSGVEVVEA